jgi:hypothetical protein
MPKYRPVPKQSLPRGNPRPWTAPRPYKIPRIRVEPDAEQMLKQLEKRFDKKLHEQVLEKLEAEFEKLQETLAKERAEREELEEMRGRQIEAFFEEHADEFTEKLLMGDFDNPEPTESIEANGGAKITENEAIVPQEIETEENIEANRKEMLKTEEDTQNEIEQIKETAETENDRIEPPNEDELYEIDDELEWFRDHETELQEISELIEPEPEQTLETIEILEPIANQEIIERPVELNEPLPTEIPIEEPIDLEAEQLVDLEPILDQIEPIEPDVIEPIEVELLPNMFPEALEEEQEAIEVEAY